MYSALIDHSLNRSKPQHWINKVTTSNLFEIVLACHWVYSNNQVVLTFSWSLLPWSRSFLPWFYNALYEEFHLLEINKSNGSLVPSLPRVSNHVVHPADQLRASKMSMTFSAKFFHARLTWAHQVSSVRTFDFYVSMKWFRCEVSNIQFIRCKNFVT